jgi:hypothetical protein
MVKTVKAKDHTQVTGTDHHQLIVADTDQTQVIAVM